MTLIAVVKPTSVPDREDNPLTVREQSAALQSRIGRIHRVLGAPAALPEVRQRAKDDLVSLAREALQLYGAV